MRLLGLVFGVTLLACAQEALTDDSIAKMVHSGLGDNLIVNIIQSQPGRYSVTPDDLVRLKGQGVSETVLAAMVSRGAPAQTVAITGVVPTNPSWATPGPGSIPVGDSNDPLVQHDSGIWVYTKDPEDKPRMALLERSAYQSVKTGGMLAAMLSAGIAKMKIRAVVAGAHSAVRIADPHPVFYFYFDEKAAGLGRTYFWQSNVSNPNQFALVRLESGKSNRETTIAALGLSGASGGADEKNMVAFKSERVRPGLYRVTVDGTLSPGEYCFLAPGTADLRQEHALQSPDIFDFGVDGDQRAGQEQARR